MELVEPSLPFIESYKSALNEFDELGITGFWKMFGPIVDEQNYLQGIKCYQHKTGLGEGVVPASTYWLVDKGEFIGHVSVRHALDDSLKRRGGHIGYAIRPSKHGLGYGSNILKLVLPHAKQLGIQSVLVTCDKENLASRRIIEKNGGVFTDEVEVNGQLIHQFWISL